MLFEMIVLVRKGSSINADCANWFIETDTSKRCPRTDWSKGVSSRICANIACPQLIFNIELGFRAVLPLGEWLIFVCAITFSCFAASTFWQVKAAFPLGFNACIASSAEFY